MDFERAEKSFGYCLFCEDVRQEVNNKLTFVGVFFGLDLTVLGVLPAHIGKFCIQAIFKQRLSEGVSDVTFEIYLPGDDDDKPSASQTASAQQMMFGLEAPTDIDDPFFQIGMTIVINPLEIKQEGKIIVVAIKEGKRFRLGQLKVRSAPLPQPNQEAAH